MAGREPRKAFEIRAVARMRHLLALHGIVRMNKALGFKGKQEVALTLQGDNLLNEHLWVPALGNPATDTVPYNKGRAAYVGLKVGF